MEKKNDMSEIKLRKCDLNSVLYMLSMGNKEAVESAWDTLELMSK